MEHDNFFRVAPSLLAQPLAFVLQSDIHSISLLYRSKQDYHNAKPLNSVNCGLLRRASFHPHCVVTTLMDFIGAQVDVGEGGEGRGRGEWYMVGEGREDMKGEIERRFKIRTRRLSELEALTSSLHHPFPSFPPNLHSVTMATRVDLNLTYFLQSTSEYKKLSPHPSPNYLSDMESMSVEEWIKKHLVGGEAIEVPCMLLLLGDASLLCSVDESYNVTLVDNLSFSAASIQALCAGVVDQEKNFLKILLLAETGDSRKVNLHWKDIKGSQESEEGFYNFPEDMLGFELGKMSSNNIKKDSYSKADVAAGVFSFLMHMLTKDLVHQARLHKMERLYACGSIFQEPLVRKEFQKWALLDSMGHFFNGVNPLKVHVLQHPGHVTALGGWLKSTEKTIGRENAKL